MKTVTIPTCANPFVVSVNHKTYYYEAGSTVEVPDDVAAVIEQHNLAHNKLVKPSDEVVTPIPAKYLPEHLQFGEEKPFEPIVWDGNTEGLETTEISDENLGMTILYAKVSENFTQISEVSKIESVIMNMGSMGDQFNDMLPYLDFEGNEHGYSLVMEQVIPFVIGSDGKFVCNDGQTLSKGVWFCCGTSDGQNPINILQFNPATILKTIEPKYLPEGIPYIEKVDKVLFEGECALDKESTNSSTDGLPDIYGVIELDSSDLLSQFVDDKKYKIILNGQTIIASSSAFSTEVFISNPMKGVRINIEDDSITVVCAQFLGINHAKFTIMEVEPENVYHPMHEELMPILTSPGGKKYKLTVADDGTVTTTAV